MSGSVAPIYLREFADLPKIESAEMYVNDNAYGANSAPNIARFAYSSTPSTPRSAVKMSDLTREEMKAEIAASEARGDTKIARFEGKLDLVLSKLDNVGEKLKDVKDDVRSARANQWVIGLGLAVLIIAIVALFPVFFDYGAKMHDMMEKIARDVLPTVIKRP